MFPIIAAYFRIGLCLTVLWHVSGDDLKPFELNDFLKGTYVNKQWNGTWISGIIRFNLLYYLWYESNA